ncbi:MAG: gamma-glutamylcyclotransferase [Ruminococcus sp.]|nr:gamma-glutamylcyclotransferase [Ruminococcus sp.]
MEKKIYFAYGSNLNREQMTYRCPDAEFFGVGSIENYTMTFKGNGAGVADIIPCEGGSVPVGIWRISPADERRLDIYEGYPRLYGKRKIYALYGGRSVEGTVYIMNAENPVKMPSEAYFNTVLQGYLDCGIDTEIFFDFVSKISEWD